MRGTSAAIVALVLAACICAQPAHAQLAVSVNDGKVRVIDGNIEILKSLLPDTVSVIDLHASPPRVIAQIEVPGSVFGSPLSVAISPKEDIALVTSGRRIDPADPTRQIPDDRLTVIDLTPLAWVGLVPLLMAIRTRRPRAAFGLGWLTGLTFWIVTCYWVVHTIGHYTAVPVPVAIGVLLIVRARHPVVGWANVLFFGAGVVLFVWQIVDRRPRLVIDDDGVFDRTLGAGVIPWSEILDAEARSIAGQPFVMLALRDPDRFTRHVGAVQRAMTAGNRALGFEALNLNLSGLPIAGDVVVDRVRQALAARAQVRQNPPA